MNRKRRKRKERIIKKTIMALTIISVGIVGTVYVYIDLSSKKINYKKGDSNSEVIKEKDKEITENKEIIITAAGDCILGTADALNKKTSFNEAMKASGNDYSFPMKNFYDIFSNDDYTMVNLENTFINESKNLKPEKEAGKKYYFKGPSEYSKILSEGSIEGVNIANNHIYDYGEIGFEDTLKALGDSNIEYFGEGYKVLKDIKGIKFGFLGYQGLKDTEELKEKIKEDIEELKIAGAKIIIPYFHWGQEKHNKFNETQRELGRYAIDLGADMVLGSHPNVIQGMENYKGKIIVYSLGNFSYGGNSNPKDKRTFVFQVKYKFQDENLVKTEYKVIPATVSSLTNKNDYSPKVAEGAEGEKILKDLNALSENLNGEIKNEFWELKE